MGKRILTILCALASLASAATPVDTIGSGDSTIIYPDNSRIYVQPNNSVTANDFTLGNNCTLVIGKFANMTIACKATTGSGCEIILESGSTLQINTTASLTLDKETHLNCKNGSLMLYAADSYLCLSADCTLSLGVIPVSGSGTIAAPEYGELKEEQHEYAFLDAPCAYIFNEVKVTGMWHIDRAYPQWFAAPGCDDWSGPINKAITLKRTGEVFLQRGLYPTKHSIRVRYGIELTGENGFISNPGKGSNSDLLGTTIVANNNSSSCSNFQSGYMVLVNTKPVEQYPSSEHIEEQFNMWVHPYPAFTTVVRNITFMNGDKSERIIPQLNGLFTAGGLDIEQCRFLNFKQAIVKSRDYADGFVIKDCRFSGVNIVHYAPPGTTSATDTTVYDTKWMIYLNGDGDNLQFTGNAFMGSRFLNNRTLYVGQNRGGLISCNITGGEIVLNGCRGLTFSNNHMESSMESNEGMLIRVLNSQVTISDNFFYKSERGNIYVAGGGYGTPSVAEIHNNTYLCTFHDLFPGITNDSIQDYYSLEERRTEFEAKKKIWLARSSAPEIIVGDGATVNISNQYRQVALLNSVTWPLTVGIQFRAENQNDSIFLTDTIATTLLNNLSPYLSGSGTINAGFAVNNVNHQLHNINRRTATMMPNRNDRWYAESGEYEYFAVFVIDRQRNIIAYPNGMKYKHLKNKGDTIIKKNNFIDNPVDANAVSTLIPIYGGTYFPKWSGYLRMYRCRVERDTIINKIVREFDWNTVDVPVVNAMMLYDNGLFLSGYPWQKCSEANPLGSLPDTDTLKLQDVTHLNESVECTATTKPSSLPDTWSRGDKIFNVGNETDWDVFIKR